MKQLFLQALAKAMNSYLHLDTESKKRLHKIQGKTITIEFLPFHYSFQCEFQETGVKLHTDNSIQTDTKIRGTPLQMLGVVLEKDDRQRFFAEDVLIEGNAEFAQQVINLFDELEIDWEEHLSHLTGDVPAYHIGKAFRSIKNWLQNTNTSFAHNINEFVHEEVEWVPTREALQDFFSDIDTLRMDVDRIEAKINLLAANINNEDKS